MIYKRNFIVIIFVLAAGAAAFEIPLSAVKRGGTPGTFAGFADRGIPEQRALLMHNARIDSVLPGVLGYYDESLEDEDILWQRFELNPGAVRFIHLTPEGDGPVRVTMGWEDEDRELDLRLTSPSYFGLPLTIDESGAVIRGDNSQLLAERVDMNPSDMDREITLQITGRDRDIFRKNSSEPGKVFLLISGARLSDRMAAQAAFKKRMKEQYARDRIDVEAYAQKHAIPIREELPGGGSRQIVRIEHGEPVYFQTLNRGAAHTSHVEKVWPEGDMDISVTGSNVSPLGLWDGGGVHSGHPDFDERVTMVDGGTVMGHGTHAAGTMIGSGRTAYNARGVAYEAYLRAFLLTDVMSRMASEAEEGMLISSHPYGTPGEYTYNTTAHTWDELHLNYPYTLGVKSAGNDGSEGFETVLDAGNAKNNITIGAIHGISGGWINPDNVDSASSSSRGPVADSDNRIKPDLVAKGVNVYSTWGEEGHQSMSGTSSAGAAAAGMLGLMQDYYYQTHDRSFMRAATVKALAIHTAGDAGTEGPNATFGWGVVHVERAARLIKNNAEEGGGQIRELTLAEGETLEFDYIGTDEEEILATIVWMDEAQANLADDLDMRVIVDGTTYEPWLLDPENPTGAAVRGDNSADNVERVNTGISREDASVQIVISHRGDLVNESRDFSLIVSGGVPGIPKSIDIISPAEGDSLAANSEHVIRWESEGDIGSVRIEWGHGGENWSDIVESAENSGSYTWTVPDTSNGECAIRISEVDKEVRAISEYFTIYQLPRIIVDDIQVDTSLRKNEEAHVDFDIENRGRGVLHASLSLASASFSGSAAESFVGVDAEELEISGESSETVRISLSAGDYDPGEYHDTVIILHNDPDTDEIRIPVRLEVRENRNPEFDDVETEYDLDPGDDFELEVSATDRDGDEVILSAEDLPAWLAAEDVEAGVIRIFGSTDETHAKTEYSFRVVALDDFDPAGQAQLEISIAVGTDIVEIDTISGGSQRGIFPAQNPGQLSAESFEFSVLTGEPAQVRIVIYDNLGNILDEQEKAGSTATGHVLSWDMRNVSGQKVGAGSYLIAAEVTYENGTQTYLRQMIGLRK
jgi:hypothetical protein